MLDEALADADTRPLAELVDALIDGAVAFWARRPAFAALWSGSWAYEGAPAPALLFGQRTVARLAAATTRFRALGPLRELTVLAAGMTIGMAIVNLASIAEGEQRELLTREAKRAVLAYLESVLTEE